MPPVVLELVSSRTTSIGQNSRHEKKYTITGTDDESDAIAAVFDEAPDHYGGTGTDPYFPYMPLRSIDVEPTNIVEGEADQCRWTGTASYAPVSGGGTGDEEVFQFQTGGTTKHITQSIDTRISAKDPDEPLDPANWHRAIGAVVTDGKASIEGVDLVSPAFNFSETHFFSDAEVDDAFKQTLCDLTGTVNNAAFKGFDAYEVLFQGATGQRRGTSNWEITFNFSAQKNQISVPVGDEITLASVRGWEYVWVQYKDELDGDAKATVQRPRFAYVEQVYRYTDFSALGLD